MLEIQDLQNLQLLQKQVFILLIKWINYLNKFMDSKLKININGEFIREDIYYGNKNVEIIHLMLFSILDKI